MKLRLLSASLLALTLVAGSAVAQDTASEKGKLSYYFGYDFGNNLQGLTERGEQIDIESLVKGLRDAYAKQKPAITAEQLKPAIEAFQKREEARGAKAKADFEKMAADNNSKSTAFLAQNKAKAGVQTLPSGVQYRVLEAGTGAKPTAASAVTLQYRGSLIDGRTFVDTYSPPPGQAAPPPLSIKVSEVPLAGLREALQMMPAGARWEVVLPADKAYGNGPQSPVGPGQAVVFDVKLVSVK